MRSKGMLRNVSMIREATSLSMEEKKLSSPKREWPIILYLYSIENPLPSTHGSQRSDPKLKIPTNHLNNSWCNLDLSPKATTRMQPMEHAYTLRYLISERTFLWPSSSEH